jgi:hypothetical protein
LSVSAEGVVSLEIGDADTLMAALFASARCASLGGADSPEVLGAYKAYLQVLEAGKKVPSAGPATEGAAASR